MPVIALVFYLLSVLTLAAAGYLAWILRGTAQAPLPDAAGTAPDAPAANLAELDLAGMAAQTAQLGTIAVCLAAALTLWFLGFVCHRLQQIRNAIREEDRINV